jgi:hypothetical protein
MNISPAWIFTGLLILWILYLTQCRQQKPCPPGQVRIAKVDTQRIISEYAASTKPTPDTVYRPGDTIYRYKTKPGKAPEPVFVEVVTGIPIKVDTQAIIRDYYSKYTFTDSLIIPSHKIFVSDTLYKNRIIGRGWRVRSETQVITKTPQQKWQIYGEGGAYTSKTEFLSGGELTLGYLNRRGQGFEFSLLRTTGQWHKGIKFHQTLFHSKQ